MTRQSTTDHLRRVKPIRSLTPGLGHYQQVGSFVCPEGSGRWVVVKSALGYGVVRLDPYGYIHLFLDDLFPDPQSASTAACCLHWEYAAMIDRTSRRRAAS